MGCRLRSIATIAGTHKIHGSLWVQEDLVTETNELAQDTQQLHKTSCLRGETEREGQSHNSNDRSERARSLWLSLLNVVVQPGARGIPETQLLTSMLSP